MDFTPASLLERLRQPGDQEAWQRFVKLYTPLLYHWARRLGLQPNDAADLVQEVFALLVQKMPEFTYAPDKRFRGWLWTMLRNKNRERRRRRAEVAVDPNSAALAELTDSDDTANLHEEEDRQRLVSRALHLMQAEFQPTTWLAYREHIIAGRPAALVAAELGISVNAVYIAKCRVLRRLREELDGLLD